MHGLEERMVGLSLEMFPNVIVYYCKKCDGKPLITGRSRHNFCHICKEQIVKELGLKAQYMKKQINVCMCDSCYNEIKN